MTVAVILLAYTAAAGTLGARLLARAGWTARAPLLAIVTYLAAASSSRAARAPDAIAPCTDPVAR